MTPMADGDMLNRLLRRAEQFDRLFHVLVLLNSCAKMLTPSRPNITDTNGNKAKIAVNTCADPKDCRAGLGF